MKQLCLSLVFLSLVTLSKAQNFGKGSLSGHANFGIDIYDTHYTNHLDYNGYTKDTVTTDKAGCKNVSVGAEYAVINHLTVGLRFKFNNYYTSQDDITKATPTAHSTDYMILANYHIVDRNVFDLSAGIAFGGSHLVYNDNFHTPQHPSGLTLNGKGPYFQFQVSPEFFIKKRVGLGMSFYGPSVNYKKMTTNDNLLNSYVITKWRGNGYGFSFNLHFIILKGEEK